MKLSNEAIQQFKQSRRTELEQLSEEDLRERFKNANGTEAEPESSRESIIERLIDLGLDRHAEALSDDRDEDEEIFGNQDTKKENALPEGITRHDGWERLTIVKQTPTTWTGGQFVSLDKQTIIQAYEPADFERMLDQKFFEESNIKIEILHEGEAVEEAAE